MRRIVTLLVGLALLLPAAAMAQGSSTCQAYNPQLCGVGGIGSSKSGPRADPGYVGGSTDGLPFTGVELGLLVASAGGLLAAGLVVRRLSRLS
jgi:hypothetical protein